MSAVSRPPAVLLMGPTASGKTGAAVELAARFPLEIVSVDSAQIYRDMDIGTAKPGPELLRRAPHHLIDILDPTQQTIDALMKLELSAGVEVEIKML